MICSNCCDYIVLQQPGLQDRWWSDSCWRWKLPHIDHPCLWPCQPCFGWSSLPIVFPDPSLYTGVRSSWFHCMPHNNHGGIQSYASLPGDSVHNYQAGGFVLGFRWSLLVLRHSIRALLTACLTTKGKIVSCKHPRPLACLLASNQPLPSRYNPRPNLWPPWPRTLLLIISRIVSHCSIGGVLW